MSKASKSNLRFITDPILEPYYIQLDDHCFIAQKRTFSVKGNEYQSTIGHYGKLGNCLEAIARDSAKSKNYSSLKTFVEAYESKSEKIKNIINL